ncbi:hypothetical protein ACFWIO_33520 [Streptomyces diastatochromogenes]|uniref:hypothetical protein n=1 Tax=Streptomyces diastatochromogenes TaxID=42236 RepID=UPI00364AF6F2
MSAYRLLDARGGVVRLRAAVALLADADERLRTRTRAELTVRWTRPWGADDEVAELLARARSHLDRGTPDPARDS